MGDKCCDGGDLSFIHPERGGDGPGDYPIYLQPLRGNWRREQGGLLQRLGCEGDTGDSTPKVYPYI